MLFGKAMEPQIPGSIASSALRRMGQSLSRLAPYQRCAVLALVAKGVHLGRPAILCEIGSADGALITPVLLHAQHAPELRGHRLRNVQLVLVEHDPASAAALLMRVCEDAHGVFGGLHSTRIINRDARSPPPPPPQHAGGVGAAGVLRAGAVLFQSDAPLSADVHGAALAALASAQVCRGPRHGEPAARELFVECVCGATGPAVRADVLATEIFATISCGEGAPETLKGGLPWYAAPDAYVFPETILTWAAGYIATAGAAGAAVRKYAGSPAVHGLPASNLRAFGGAEAAAAAVLTTQLKPLFCYHLRAWLPPARAAGAASAAAVGSVTRAVLKPSTARHERMQLTAATALDGVAFFCEICFPNGDVLSSRPGAAAGDLCLEWGCCLIPFVRRAEAASYLLLSRRLDPAAGRIVYSVRVHEKGAGAGPQQQQQQQDVVLFVPFPAAPPVAGGARNETPW